MKNTFEYLAWVAIVLPLVYLFLVWNQLPDIVPTHFGPSGKPDAYGPKWTLTILSAVSIGVYFLLRYVPQLDPRLNKASLSEHYPKLILLIVTFLALVHCLVIRASLSEIAGESFTTILLVGVFLLFAGIGNYFNNIKSNYFVGFRTPWTLESETVWRKTHQLAAKLYFRMGLIGAFVVIWLPELWKLFWTLGLIFGSTIWIVVYSYRVYQQEKK